MFDIGTMELLLVAIIALVVVGPRELPALLKSIGGFVRKIRMMGQEFRSGLDDLAAEVERETDPFSDLRKKEGITPDMTPEEITAKIMANREAGIQVDVEDNTGTDMASNSDKKDASETASKSDEK